MFTNHRMIDQVKIACTECKTNNGSKLLILVVFVQINYTLLSLYNSVGIFFFPYLRLPSDVELVRLRPEHMKAVHDLYPASDIECREVFEKLVAELPAYGIFVEDQLAAWMVQSYYGAMFSMQTRPEFRRKGYGIFLAKRLTKEVASRGYKPFVVIRPENDASRSLYSKLGFEKRFRTVRAILRPR